VASINADDWEATLTQPDAHDASCVLPKCSRDGVRIRTALPHQTTVPAVLMTQIEVIAQETSRTNILTLFHVGLSRFWRIASRKLPAACLRDYAVSWLGTVARTGGQEWPKATAEGADLYGTGSLSNR